MSATRYTGPERRSDGFRDVMEKLDQKLDEHREHTDRRLDEIKDHFDSRMTELNAKVDPMHDYFITAKTGAAIIKWVVAVVGALAGGWLVIKGWLLAILK